MNEPEAKPGSGSGTFTFTGSIRIERAIGYGPSSGTWRASTSRSGARSGLRAKASRT